VLGEFQGRRDNLLRTAPFHLNNGVKQLNIGRCKWAGFLL